MHVAATAFVVFCYVVPLSTTYVCVCVCVCGVSHVIHHVYIMTHVHNPVFPCTPPTQMMESMQAKHSQIYGTKLGSDAMMQVRFREIEPTNLWLWFEMQQTPSDKEREMLQEVRGLWGVCVLWVH